MSVDFTKKTWYDGSEGGTPITAAELNRVETGIDDVITQSNADKTNIDTHLAKKINSSDGAHGLRYYNSELDYYDDTNEEWVEIQTGGGGSEVIKPYFESYLSQASRNYAIGDNIYVQQTNTLYVATAVITDLDELEVGVNIAIVTDEGTEVCVEGIPNSGVYYNLIGLLNSNGTVTPYGNTKASDDIANKSLSNIQNTTTTAVEYRYINTSNVFIADRWDGWKYVNGKYIKFVKESSTIYTCVSDDGYTLTSKDANDLPDFTNGDGYYIFHNAISGLYITLYSIDYSVMCIYTSTNLTTWTKVILPNSVGTDYAQGNYLYQTSTISDPIGFELNGDTYIVAELGYRKYEDQEQTTQTDYTAVITVRNGNDFTVTNSNLLSLNTTIDTDVISVFDSSSYGQDKVIIGNVVSSDGITYSKYTVSNNSEIIFVNRVSTNYHVWCKDNSAQTIKIYTTTDFSTFTESLSFSSLYAKYSGMDDYFPYMRMSCYNIEFRNEKYFVVGTTSQYSQTPYKGAILVIPTTFNVNDTEWVALPDLPSSADGDYYEWMLNNPKVATYNTVDYVEYDILNVSPFTSEVSKALVILDVNSGSGGGGTGNYPDLTNKPSINGVELLGNKLVGLLSTDIHINANKIGYNGTVSGASTTKAAIDALQSSLSGLHGIPSGGNTNQVLAKNSSSDYDLKWVNQTGGGSGFKIIVTAPVYPNKSVTVTESDSGDTVTETTDANGVATFIVSAGTWTATTLVGGATVTLGSVTVGTTSIEYSGVRFAFHYSENDSSPDSVTYPSGYDNSNWGSDTAYMDFTNDTFHYGNWNPSGTNATMLSWLFPKPCMLKSDGTVDYYLDPNDYTKKVDGTASDIANTSYDGNAMMEWGQNGNKIYWKIIPDSDNKGFTFCVANAKFDEDYDCWNHYDCDNVVKDHFYTPIYFGSLVSSKLRSLSGQTNSVSTTRQNEIDYATANNTDSKVHWYTEVYSDWLLQGMLTTLITKSLDSQTKIGKGRTNGNNSSAINTGTMNTKGLFWGSTNGTDGVKCWGMENTWGNLWRAIGGLIASTQTIKVKLTPNNYDGTTATSYNIDGTGYTTANTLSGSSGYISHMYATKKSLTPATLSGSESTYYCDYCYTIANTNTYYAVVGGYWSTAAYAGAFFVALDRDASYANANRGAALSYK